MVSLIELRFSVSLSIWRIHPSSWPKGSLFLGRKERHRLNWSVETNIVIITVVHDFHVVGDDEPREIGLLTKGRPDHVDRFGWVYSLQGLVSSLSDKNLDPRRWRTVSRDRSYTFPVILGFRRTRYLTLLSLLRDLPDTPTPCFTLCRLCKMNGMVRTLQIVNEPLIINRTRSNQK